MYTKDSLQSLCYLVLERLMLIVFLLCGSPSIFEEEAPTFLDGFEHNMLEYENV